MNTVAQIYIGIDISKDFLDIHLYPLEKAFRITNDMKGIKKLLRMLSKYEVINIVFESSGGYEYLLSKELSNKMYSYWQVEPRRIKAFIISEGVHVKTDKIDAKMIALFAAQKRPKYDKAQPTFNEERICALAKCRADLIQMMVKEKNRKKHPAQIHCRDRISKHIAFIEKEIKEIDKELDELIKTDEKWKKQEEIITSVPGLGKVSASGLIAGLPELGKLTNKEIASLVGVAPIIQQSGASKGTSTVKGGRRIVRNILYMASVVAMRHNPTIKIFYNRLRKAGKAFKVAIVAVMRKLIVILNVMVKKGETWQAA